MLVRRSFRAVAARSQGAASGTADTMLRLLAKLKQGGAGAWDSLPKPAKGEVSEADARKVVEWILGGAQ